jgi:hypothetical protein
MSEFVLAKIAVWEVKLFLGALIAIIAWKLLTGRINTRYLLYGRRGDGKPYFSPERVQLLVTTIGVAIQYLISASHANGQMPKLPDGSLQIFGASNAVFLGGKALAFTRKTLKGQEENS